MQFCCLAGRCLEDCLEGCFCATCFIIQPIDSCEEFPLYAWSFCFFLLYLMTLCQLHELSRQESRSIVNEELRTERKGVWHILTYCSGIFLDGLRKNSGAYSQDYPGLDMKLGSHKQKSAMITIRHWMWECLCPLGIVNNWDTSVGRRMLQLCLQFLMIVLCPDSAVEHPNIRRCSLLSTLR